MIAQKVGRGTARPVQFVSLCWESQLNQTQMQEFIYHQCFNYLNWTGPVRVPGVLQYASKLVKFQGEHLKSAVNAKFRNFLYFI